MGLSLGVGSLKCTFLVRSSVVLFELGPSSFIFVFFRMPFILVRVVVVVLLFILVLVRVITVIWCFFLVWVGDLFVILLLLLVLVWVVIATR